MPISGTRTVGSCALTGTDGSDEPGTPMASATGAIATSINAATSERSLTWVLRSRAPFGSVSNLRHLESSAVAPGRFWQYGQG